MTKFTKRCWGVLIYLKENTRCPEATLGPTYLGSQAGRRLKKMIEKSFPFLSCSPFPNSSFSILLSVV